MTPPSPPRIDASRRQFLATTTRVVAASTLGFPTIIPRSALAAPGRPGANDRVAVGAIGVGGRATLLLQQLPESAQIVALCDCNLSRAEAFRAKAQANWPVHQNFRELLDRQDVDAVIVATGEFQRIVPCIEACRAGKDIYAEKPLSLYVREGRALVEAARKYQRVVQVGTQQRSMAMNRVACELVRSGRLGKLLEVRAVKYTGPEDSPQPYPQGTPVPEGLDWNLWLNQAAFRPYHADWMAWMRWRDFGGGEMTNWGAHGVDQIQWALGADDTGPVSIEPVTAGPHGQVTLRYANGVPVHFNIEDGKGPMGGAVFICEQGKLEINRNKFVSNPPEIATELKSHLDVAEEERKWSDELALWQARWHLQNWLDCLHSRATPVASAEIGHRSITVCHLVNIARQLGRKLTWDPAQEAFVGDVEANQLLDRPRREGFSLPT